MYQILEKRRLSSNVVLLVIDAPYVAKKAEPGQFIILRVDADGERIPLTISAYDRKKGTITIVVQEVGATTMGLMRRTVSILCEMMSGLASMTS